MDMVHADISMFVSFVPRLHWLTMYLIFEIIAVTKPQHWQPLVCFQFCPRYELLCIHHMAVSFSLHVYVSQTSFWQCNHTINTIVWRLGWSRCGTMWYLSGRTCAGCFSWEIEGEKITIQHNFLLAKNMLYLHSYLTTLLICSLINVCPTILHILEICAKR